MSVVVRSTAGFAAVAGALQRAVWDVDPSIPTDVNSMRGRIAGTIAAPRFYTLLLSSFAAVALILASVGIYGTMAYTVGERTQEMGVRIALGASGPAVLRVVVGRAAVLTVAGLLLGLGVGLVSARLLASLLYGVDALDPVMHLLTALAVLGVAVTAASLPVMHGLRLDPAEALKAE